MARFLDEKELITKHVESFLENTTSNFSKYLQGTPTFVLYFNKNVTASSQDVGLENVKQIVGGDAPVKYNKIEDLPLYSMESLTPNITFDESFGLDTESEGEAVILPNTIKPFIDDFFIIEYQGEQYLYKVNNVQTDKLNGKKYYKISFMLGREEFDLLDEQIEEEYVSHFEDIGSNTNPIVKKSDSILLDEIIGLQNLLIDFYVKSYYDYNYNIITYNYNNQLLMNDSLNSFISKFQILNTKRKRYLKTYYIEDYSAYNQTLVELYETTLYYAMETGRTDRFVCENIKLFNYPLTPLVPMYFDTKKYMSCLYVKDINDLNPHNNELIKNINNDIYFQDSEEYFLENIIIQFFNKKLIINKDLIDKILKHNFKPFFKEYLLLPCLIFILNGYIKSIINK